MPEGKNQINDAALRLNESLREVNQALANSAVAAQERNVKFAQGVFENTVEVLRNHAEDSRSLMQEMAGQPERRHGLMQTVADRAIAAQERNMKLAQSALLSGGELLKSHVEGSRELMQTFAQQAQRQQEAYQELARASMETYLSFFSAPFSYYQQAMRTAESIIMRGAEAAQKVTEQEKQTVHTATR
jgi:hypothetical protein